MPIKDVKVLPSKRMCWAKPMTPPITISNIPAIVHPIDTSDADVKRRTDFMSMFQLLSFVLIVCNGSLDLMTKKLTCLTWCEEWFMYFEWAYGRTHMSLGNLARAYKTSHRSTVKIILAKLQMVLNARSSWPKYASLIEDESLRNSAWAHYNSF